MKQAGIKMDRAVFSSPDHYASFPQIFRTGKEIVLVFQVQELKALRAIEEHPHYQKVAKAGWAMSRDEGLTWEIMNTAPQVGKILDASYASIPLSDGGTATLSFHPERPKYALLRQGPCGYRPYLSLDIQGVEKYPFNDFGPYDNFFPHGIVRVSDGIIASGYAGMPASMAGTDWTKTTALFLKSTDEGKTWTYLSAMPNNNIFSFSEPDLLAGPGNLLQAFLRVDWAYVPKEKFPADAGAGEEVYGYYLYRSESRDGGQSWSEPVQLPLWGHPPCVKRLASGNILLVYGVRRKPFGIQAVLSRDNGKSWDLKTLKQIYTFDPGGYDLGYPVATEFPDGRILCAFYGYSTPEIQGKMPHGIFVTMFDEGWLTS